MCVCCLYLQVPSDSNKPESAIKDQDISTATHTNTLTHNTVKKDGNTDNKSGSSLPHSPPLHAFSELIGDISSSSDSETENDKQTVPFSEQNHKPSDSHNIAADTVSTLGNEKTDNGKDLTAPPATSELTKVTPQSQSCNTVKSDVKSDTIPDDPGDDSSASKQEHTDNKTESDTVENDCKPLQPTERKHSQDTADNCVQSKDPVDTDTEPSSCDMGSKAVVQAGVDNSSHEKEIPAQCQQSTAHNSDKKDITSRLKNIRPVKRVIRKAAAVLPELDIMSRKYPMRDSKANTPEVSDEEISPSKTTEEKSSVQSPSEKTISDIQSAMPSKAKKRIARVQSLPVTLTKVDSMGANSTSEVVKTSAPNEPVETSQDSISQPPSAETKALDQPKGKKRGRKPKIQAEGKTDATEDVAVKKRRGRPKKSDKAGVSNNVEASAETNNKLITAPNIGETSEAPTELQQTTEEVTSNTVTEAEDGSKNPVISKACKTSKAEKTTPVIEKDSKVADGQHTDKAKQRLQHRQTWLQRAVATRATEELKLTKEIVTSKETDSAWEIALRASKWAAAKKRGEIPADAAPPVFKPEAKPHVDPRKCAAEETLVEESKSCDQETEKTIGLSRKSPRLRPAAPQSTRKSPQNVVDLPAETDVSNVQDKNKTANNEPSVETVRQVWKDAIDHSKELPPSDEILIMSPETDRILRSRVTSNEEKVTQKQVDNCAAVKGPEAEIISTGRTLRTRNKTDLKSATETSDSECEIAALPDPPTRRSLRSRNTTNTTTAENSTRLIDDKVKEFGFESSDSGTPCRPPLRPDLSAEGDTGEKTKPFTEPESVKLFAIEKLTATSVTKTADRLNVKSDTSLASSKTKSDDSDMECLPEPPNTRSLRSRSTAKPVNVITSNITETEVKSTDSSPMRSPKITKTYTRQSKELTAVRSPPLSSLRKRRSSVVTRQEDTEQDEPVRRRTRSSALLSMSAPAGDAGLSAPSASSGAVCSNTESLKSGRSHLSKGLL